MLYSKYSVDAPLYCEVKHIAQINEQFKCLKLLNSCLNTVSLIKKLFFSHFDSLHRITWTSKSIFPVYNSKYDDVFRKHSF